MRKLLHSKKIGVFLIVLVVLLVGAVNASFAQSPYTSVAPGNWNSDATWSGTGIPGVGDIVNINHDVTINYGDEYTVNSIFISNKLTVNGTLTINGDLSTDVNGEFVMGSNAVVIVKDDVLLGNKCTIDLSSYFIVLGDFTKSGSDGQGLIQANGAHIYILGKTTAPPYFTVCDQYSGTTTNTTSTCDGGTFEALITNPSPIPIITDIIQQAIAENTTNIDNLSPVSSCLSSGGSVVLTIGDATTPTGVSIVKWYQGATLLSTQMSPAKPYTHTATQAGTYNALYKIGTTWYQTNSVTVTNATIPTAVISGSTTICQGSSATLSIALNGTGPWDFTYTDGTTPVTVTGQTTSPYPVNVSPSSTKTYTLTSLSTTCFSGITSGAVTITVNPGTVAGAVNGSATVCTGTNSTNLTLIGNTGNVVKWQSSTISDFSSAITDISNTSTTLTAVNLTSTTYYRAVVKIGSCPEANSGVASVTVNPATVAGTVTGGTPICTGSTSGLLTLGAHTGSVIRWESSVSPFTTWTSITNTADTYISGALTATTQFRAVVQSGVCSSATSQAATVTVDPATVSGTVSGNAIVCAGTNSTLLTLSSHIGNILRWESSLDGSIWTPIVNTTASYTATNLTATTQFRAVVQSGVCTTENSGAALVTVNADASLSLTSGSATPEICINNAITDIVYSIGGAGTGASITSGSLPTGLTGTYNSGAKTFTISGTPSDSGTFPFTVTTAGSFCVNPSLSGTITINTLPTATISGTLVSCVTTTLTAVSDAVSPTYVWYKEDVVIGGETSSTLVVAASGSYKVKVKNGSIICEQTSEPSTVMINPMPLAYTVTGGGSYCMGGSGLSISLSDSETGVTYELYNDGAPTGVALLGTGSSLTYTGVVVAGTYTVLAILTSGDCQVQMAGTAIITIGDTEKPQITQCLPDGTADCVKNVPTGKTTYQDFYDAGGRVTDNCTPFVDLKVTFADVIDPNSGCKLKRTYTIADISGNEATCTQLFTITDTEAPVINSVVNLLVSPNDISCGASLSVAAPTDVNENCSLVAEGAYYAYTIAGTYKTGHGAVSDIFPEGTTLITWTITDVCGNISFPRTQTVEVGFNLTAVNYDDVSSKTGLGSGVQPMQTSTHEYFVDNKSPESDYTYSWGLYADNSGVLGAAIDPSLYTLSNVNQAHVQLAFKSNIPTNNYIISVIKTRNATTCAEQRTIQIAVKSNSSFDVVLDNLGNQCQASSGNLTTISWNVTFPNVITEPFMFSYSIKLGGTEVASGNVANITYAGAIPMSGLSAGAQTSKSANSQVVAIYYSLYGGLLGTDLARTVEIEINATDAFQVSEPNRTNNIDDLKINQVPVITFE